MPEPAAAAQLLRGGGLVQGARPGLAARAPIYWGVRLGRHNRDRPTSVLRPGPGGFVLSGEREALLALADRIPLDIVGEVTADGGVSGSCGGAAFAVDRAALETAHDALARLFP